MNAIPPPRSREKAAARENRQDSDTPGATLYRMIGRIFLLYHPRGSRYTRCVGDRFATPSSRGRGLHREAAIRGQPTRFVHNCLSDQGVVF
jgi:hypothetical protein